MRTRSEVAQLVPWEQPDIAGVAALACTNNPEPPLVGQGHPLWGKDATHGAGRHVVGQGDPSQGTTTLLPCPAGTGTLCPAMSHHARPRSGEQPPRSGSRATSCATAVARGIRGHPG